MKFSLKRLTEGLSKTKDSLLGKVKQVVGLHAKVDDELLVDLEEALIKSDVGISATERIIDGLKKRVKEKGDNDSGAVVSLLKSEISQILQSDDHRRSFFDIANKPFVVMVVGVNGTGKTTSVGKLAHTFKQNGMSVLIAACDTFRAAAIEQLEIWAGRNKCDFIRSTPGSDSAAVAFDAVQAAKSRGIDAVLIDTAGRLHTKINLMEELKKIKRVVTKADPTAPHEILLAIDATTGQNGIQQVKVFDEALDLTGLLLTKLDGTAKGGIVIAIADEFKVPVRFVGLGEKIDDLDEFSPSDFAEALFG
jgi:fused signal recognition particle receptor